MDLPLRAQSPNKPAEVLAKLTVTSAAEKNRAQGATVPDYELLRRIGKGSYGEVWIARSRATGTLRAAKIVWRHTFEDDRPFQREFEGIQKFESISRGHPSQLALFHIGRNDSEGYFYYVMELADDLNAECGVQNAESDPNQATPTPHSALPTPHSYAPHTLRAELEHGRLPAARVLEIGLALSEALGHLHSHGLVHRDVKPSNVVFVNGRPKLADIGLVTDVGDGRSIVGTEGYLAPEGPGTPQADIFALGKVLYEAATGLDRRQLPQLPADLRAWPDAKHILELNEILLKSCAADARQRYPSVERVYADLAILKSGQSVKHLRTVERRLAILTKAGVVAGVCAVIVAGIFYETNRQKQVALRSLVRLHVANGKRSLDNGDLFGSLLSFTEALRRDAGNAQREECHRIRIASVLRECPKLAGLFAHGDASINDAAFSPDDQFLVTASADDRTAQVWDLATGGRRFSLLHSAPIYSAAFSPNGDRIATSTENLVHLWSATNGEALDQRPIRHQGKYPGPHPRFSPDGGRLLTLEETNVVRIWNPVTGEALGQPLRHDEQVSFFAFSPDGQRIITLSRDGLARLWDASTRESVGPRLKHEGSVNCGAFSPDGRIVATGGDDHCVQIWDAASGNLIPAPMTNYDRVDFVEFSPEGGRLATACRDGTVELWDGVTRRGLLRPLQHDAKVIRVGFSPDGRWLVTSSQGNRVRLWDTDTGKALAPPLVHSTGFGPVAFSADGHLVLTRRSELMSLPQEVAVVWNLARVEPPRLRIRPATYFRPDSLSPDGRLKASISGYTVRTFEPILGKSLTQPLVHTVPVRQTFFSRDNAVLVTESTDGRGQAWDLSAGEPLTPLLKIRYDRGARVPVKADLLPDIRLWKDLVPLAQLLSGNRADETGGLSPVESAALMRGWNELKGKREFRDTFTTSAEEVLAWHDQEAKAFEQAWNWWSARFHLNFLVKARPGNQALEARRAYAQQALDAANGQASGYLERRCVTPPRNPLASRAMIDLSAYYNLPKRVGDDPLAGLPNGLQTFAGTAFDVRGVVQLSGPKRGAAADGLPEQVRDIRVNQKCHRLHFLQATASAAEDGTEVGSYVVHYADRRTDTISIVYGRDVRSRWTAQGEPLTTDKSALVWMDTDPHLSEEPRSLRMFKSTWENPFPEWEVTGVDFVCSRSDATPFLVAMTAE